MAGIILDSVATVLFGFMLVYQIGTSELPGVEWSIKQSIFFIISAIIIGVAIWS